MPLHRNSLHRFTFHSFFPLCLNFWLFVLFSPCLKPMRGRFHRVWNSLWFRFFFFYICSVLLFFLVSWVCLDTNISQFLFRWNIFEIIFFICRLQSSVCLVDILFLVTGQVCWLFLSWLVSNIYKTMGIMRCTNKTVTSRCGWCDIGTVRPWHKYMHIWV